MLGATIRLLLFALLARMVTPADFGVITGAMILVGLAELMIAVGAGPALIQQNELSRDDLATAFWTTLAISLALIALALGLREALAALLGVPELAPVLPALMLVLLFKGLQAVPNNLLRRSMRFRELALVDAAGFVVSYGGVGLSLALLGYGYWSLVIATIVQGALQCLAVWALARPPLGGRVRAAALFRLYRFGAGTAFTRVVHDLLNNTDKWLVGYRMGAESLGIYGRASALANFPHGLVANAIDKVVFAAFARRQEDTAVLRSACLRAYGLAAFALFPVAALAAILAPEIVHILLGPGWERAIVPLQLLAWRRACAATSSSLPRWRRRSIACTGYRWRCWRRA